MQGPRAGFGETAQQARAAAKLVAPTRRRRIGTDAVREREHTHAGTVERLRVRHAQRAKGTRKRARGRRFALLVALDHKKKCATDAQRIRGQIRQFRAGTVKAGTQLLLQDVGDSS